MKNFRVVFLVMLALLVGSVAQAQQFRVQGTIPFNFLVGDRLYPAGNYTHSMGVAYFLYQIWIGGNDIGSEFPVSKTEIEMASNQPKPDVVILAANIAH